MKKNNRGMSLIELIIAVGMLAIVGAMIVSFVAISTRTYTNVSAEIDVQQEAQLTINQIKDLVIDTNRGLAFGLEAPDAIPSHNFTEIDATNTETSISTTWLSEGINADYIKKVLVIYNEKSTTTTAADGTIVKTYTYPVVKIIYDKGKNQLYYAEHVFPDVASINISSFGTTTTSDFYLLSKYVTDFNVDLTNILDSQVEMQIDFSSASQAGVGRIYLATPTINLRNKVIASENLSQIYTGTGVSTSPAAVLSVAITGNNTIQRGSSVDYDATVVVKDGALEGYTWELTGDPGIKSTISTDGILTVPLDEPSSMLTLTATSEYDNLKEDSISISLENPASLTVTINPDNAVTLSRGETATFIAIPLNVLGDESNLTYLWEITGDTNGITLTNENSNEATVTVDNNLDWDSNANIELILKVSENINGITREFTDTKTLNINKVEIFVTKLSTPDSNYNYFYDNFEYSLTNIVSSSGLTKTLSYSGKLTYKYYNWTITHYFYDLNLSFFTTDVNDTSVSIQAPRQVSYNGYPAHIEKLTYKFTITGTNGNSVTTNEISISE